MKTVDQLQTMSISYQEICQGEEPWIALGNFMNDWFDDAKDRRQTPEPFTRRNIYCGNRMFENKYEIGEQYRRFGAARSSANL